MATENGGFPFKGATLDSRLVKPGMLYVALKGERADGNDFIPQAREKGAAMVIGGPSAVEELHDLARRYRRALSPRTAVVGILSCAGKTWATEGNHNNHLGLPLTILNCPADADFLVLEMGTNHPGEIDALCAVAEPDAGLVTNIGTAHLEFFGSQDGIAAEKGRLLAYLGRCPGSRARPFGVVSAGCCRLERLRELCAAELVEVDPAQRWMAEALAATDFLPGPHNVSNACLAFALAERFGVTREQAVEALKRVSLPGARWRRVEIDGVTYIDDSYNANPDSMIAALDALAAMPCDGKRVAVLGDMLELGPESAALHRKVFDHAMGLGLQLVIGVGEESSKCMCHLAYKTLDPLKRKFRFDVSAGDLVLVKASNSMKLGSLLER